jgi:Fic family protein
MSIVSTYPHDMSSKWGIENMKIPTFNSAMPYNDLPALPPTAEIESKAVLRQCIKSRSALAGLKEAAELIPNPGMLINTLPILEAQASSEIENIVTTTDKLFQQMSAVERADPATKEALRYRQALMKGFNELDAHPITTRTAEAICSQIRGVEMQVRRVPGTALVSAATGETIYTPPEGESLIRDLLANWERLLHDEQDLDPLLRLAIGHYQFEAIHPFTDGNGRTGRVLNSLFLVQEGLISLPILYLSRYIIDHKSEYYRLLLEVTAHGQWEPWLLYMLRAIETTALWTLEKIATIRTLASVTVEYVRQRLPKIYSRELVDQLFMQPYCRIANLVDAGIAQRQAASRYLKKLVEIEVLQDRKVGREVLFVHPRLLELLTTDDNNVEPYETQKKVHRPGA